LAKLYKNMPSKKQKVEVSKAAPVVAAKPSPQNDSGDKKKRKRNRNKKK
jgi:hypothetical protein